MRFSKKFTLLITLLSFGLYLAGCDDVPEPETPDDPYGGEVVPPETADEIDTRDMHPVTSDLGTLNTDHDWQIGDTFEIQVADTMDLSLNVTNVARPIGDVRSISGVVGGDAAGTFTVSIDRNRMLGNLMLDMPIMQFRIAYDNESESHQVYQLMAPQTEIPDLDY